MTVNVYNQYNKLIQTFHTLAGFQLDRYLINQYPNTTIDLKYKNNTLVADVRNDVDDIILTYIGIYD